MAEVVKRGKSLKKEIKKKIRQDDKIFLTNIGLLIASIVVSFKMGNIIPFLLWIVYRKLIDKKWKKAMADVDIARAGMTGELITERVIDTLPNSYKVFADISIKYEGKESQIDHVVIGTNGVFVVETKYWSGDVIAGDDENRVIQVSRYGGKKEHYHPSKQVGTHVYRLSSILKENGIQTWVNGCVFFSNDDVKVYVENENYPLFDRAGGLITYLKTEKEENEKLTNDKIKEIVKVIKQNLV